MLYWGRYLDASFGLAYVLLLVGISFSWLFATVRVIRGSASQGWKIKRQNKHVVLRCIQVMAQKNKPQLRQFELVTPGSSPDASIIYKSIKLTLLAPCRPGDVLQRRPFGRRLRPRGDRLDGPRLFSRQSLQTDVSFLKHLLDVLQALQCLQDTGLQTDSSQLTFSHRHVTTECPSQRAVPWCPRTGRPHTGCGGSSGQSTGSFLLTPGSVQCQSALTQPLLVTDIYPQPGRPAGKYQTHTTGSPVHKIIHRTIYVKHLKTGNWAQFGLSEMCPCVRNPVEKSKFRIWGIKLGSEIENMWKKNSLTGYLSPHKSFI